MAWLLESVKDYAQRTFPKDWMNRLDNVGINMLMIGTVLGCCHVYINILVHNIRVLTVDKTFNGWYYDEAIIKVWQQL